MAVAPLPWLISYLSEVGLQRSRLVLGEAVVASSPGEHVAQMGWRCSPPDSVLRLTSYRAAQEKGLGQERVGVWSVTWPSHCSPQGRAVRGTGRGWML